METIYDLAEQYADRLIESADFKKLVELKTYIKTNLRNTIVAFKTAEAKYLEVKEYGKYHPDLKKYQTEFINLKTKLYKNPYVMEYKELERKLQSKLDSDLNDLKKSVSNKFKLSFF